MISFIVRNTGRAVGFFISENRDGREEIPVDSLQEAVTYLAQLPTDDMPALAIEVLVRGRTLPILANYRFWDLGALSPEQIDELGSRTVQLHTCLVGWALGKHGEVEEYIAHECPIDGETTTPA